MNARDLTTIRREHIDKRYMVKFLAFVPVLVVTTHSDRKVAKTCVNCGVLLLNKHVFMIISGMYSQRQCSQ